MRPLLRQPRPADGLDRFSARSLPSGSSVSRRTQPCFEWPRHPAVNHRTVVYSPAPSPADDLYAS